MRRPPIIRNPIIAKPLPIKKKPRYFIGFIFKIIYISIRKYLIKWFRYASFPFIWKKHRENLIYKRKMIFNSDFKQTFPEITSVFLLIIIFFFLLF